MKFPSTLTLAALALLSTTTQASGDKQYALYVANTGVYDFDQFQTWLISGNDEVQSPYKYVPRGKCVKISARVDRDAVLYGSEGWLGRWFGNEFASYVSECKFMDSDESSTQSVCDLPNLPENACVFEI